MIADSYALEYTLNPDVALDRGVRPWPTSDPPSVDLASAQRPRGRRPDGGSRLPVSLPRPRWRIRPTTRSDGGAGAARRSRGVRAPVLLALAGATVALLTLIPLGYVVVYAVDSARPRPGTCSCARGCVELLRQHPGLLVGVVVLSVVLGVGGAWLVERTDLPLRSAVARAVRGPAGGAGVRQLLRLGLADPVGAGLRRRAAGGQPVLLPAGLPAGARRPAHPGPRPGGRRPGPWAAAGGRRSAGSCCAAAPGDPGRGAAGGAARAGRVRRAADARLPDAHHRDLRPVPLVVQLRPANILSGVLLLLCLVLLLVELGSAATPRCGGWAAAASGRRTRWPWAGSRPWPWPRRAGLVALSLGVPSASLLHWLRVGSSTAFPLDELVSRGGDHRRPRRGGRRGRRRARPAGGVAGGAAPGSVSTLIERSHVRRPRAAGHRGRRWRWSRSRRATCRGSTRPLPLLVAGYADAVPAPGGGQHPREPRARRAGAGGRRAQPGSEPAARPCGGSRCR